MRRIIAEKPKETLFSRQRKYIQCWNPEPTEPGYVNILELAEAMCRYDLDDMDLYWLQELNGELGEMGKGAASPGRAFKNPAVFDDAFIESFSSIPFQFRSADQHMLLY